MSTLSEDTKRKVNDFLQFLFTGVDDIDYFCTEKTIFIQVHLNELGQERELRGETDWRFL